MPRLRLELNEYRDEIYSRIFEDRDTLDDIVSYLRDEKEITITSRTIQRRCTEWGFVQRPRDTPPELIEAVRISFFGSHLTDSNITEDLQDLGFRVSTRQVQVVRLAQGWKRRANTLEELQEQREKCVRAIRDALAEGTIRGYE